ncbi:hypothetical protein Pmani_014566 [Petrolisthes manimaculis]|uniref:Trehalase n=1 Tax=Petrolisthes manimaculis TaxID=1843537 RepID=A0AAE1U8L8_9EUCA|nr:hypothetical protein Pmani_014566 [Petrolisthes manimaculis]
MTEQTTSSTQEGDSEDGVCKHTMEPRMLGISWYHGGQWLVGMVLLSVMGSSSSISTLSISTPTPAQVSSSPPAPKLDAMERCKVFCNPKILYFVQGMQIFNDSKHFLDLKLKHPPQEVEDNFTHLLNTTKHNPSRQQVKEYLEENFDDSESALVPWIPGDWNPTPKYVKDVYDLPLRNWIQEVNARWKVLGRKLSEDVKINEDLTSQIYVPNPFIIPGGRFTEMYYWDSYWIIEGLLLSGMHDTAKEKEYSFWLKKRSITITVDNKRYRVFQYNEATSEPRPESYHHDQELVKNLPWKDKVRVLSGLKSAAESGWDFSSRWMLTEDGVRTKNMTDLNTMAIAPVCLNSLMGLNARLLSEFYDILENNTKSKIYKSLADEMNTTMSRVFWSERDGVWLDYNILRLELIPGFYPSNLMPLWTETYGSERSPKFIIEQVVAYLDRNNISSFPGGIPTSCVNSGEQWDLPNGWAPLQYIVVMGLHKASKYSHRAETLALSFARVWVLNVYYTYLNNTPHELMEKYKVTEVGSAGQGGEYITQIGFGWTNGVVIKFLSLYGHKIKTRETYDPVPMAVGIVLVIVALISIACYMHRTNVFQRIRWDESEKEEHRHVVP